jgi:isoleucyl-tRNA synthetase
MAQDAYFINIQKIKARMQELNQEINWIPAHIKEGRFLNTIQTAPDWCISRNRYWATIMPIWKSEDCDEIVIGSIAEMAQYTDQIQFKDGKYYFQNRPVDLHRDVCDQIVLTKGNKQYYRIPEVLDCWMDSGSAPFAEYHYPFENKETFERSQPADFIIEYVGQIRAWFNVLLRISTMTFDRNAYTNVICTGVLAGTDGRKMSKSFGNYPDPRATIEKYGADALRLYFMSSPVMIGEDMNFNEQDLADQLKSVLNILWHSYKYYQTYRGMRSTTESTTHLLDTWIKIRLRQTILTIASGLDQYNIPQATRAIRPFVDDLSTWYIDATALQTLHDVLETFAKAAAPIIPFITENIFRGLNPEKLSVHLEDYPQVSPLTDADQKLLESMHLTRQIASLGQASRLQAGIKIKQPLAALYLKLPEGIQLESGFLQIIADELNVKTIEFRTDFDESHTVQEDRNIQIALNTHITPELQLEGMLREVMRALQEFRKQQGMQVHQEISLNWFSNDSLVQQVFQKHQKELCSSLKIRELVEVTSSDHLASLLQGQLHAAIITA